MITHTIIPFIIGILSLYLGGSWLVKGAQSVGFRLKLSPMVTGLTIVAFGTSAPELVVNLIASYRHQPDIVFGNIIGSNLANMLLILGCTGLIFPLVIQKSKLVKEMGYTILFPIALLILLLIVPPIMAITPFKALILLVIFGYFLIDVIVKKACSSSISEPDQLPLFISLTYLILGIILLPIGGQLVIDSASMIALSLGVSQALISLLAIAIGTSLPELSASIMAAIHHDTDIAIGNVLGSNIFNIGLILGLSGLVSPLSISSTLIHHLYGLIIVSLLFSVGIFFKKSHQITRFESGLLLCGYVIFFVIVMSKG